MNKAPYRIWRNGLRDTWSLEIHGVVMVIPGSVELSEVLGTASRIAGKSITWSVWLRGPLNLTLEGR